MIVFGSLDQEIMKLECDVCAVTVNVGPSRVGTVGIVDAFPVAKCIDLLSLAPPKSETILSFQVLLEIFGSPFMRSINVVIALLFGYFVAAVSRNADSEINFDGFVPENFDQYVVSDKIDAGVCACVYIYGVFLVLVFYTALDTGECFLAHHVKTKMEPRLFAQLGVTPETAALVRCFPPAIYSWTLLHPVF